MRTDPATHDYEAKIRGFTPCEAVASAARYVQREWGETGYSISNCVGLRGAYYVFIALASDGSRFAVGADRWGNTIDLALWAEDQAE